MIWPWPWPRPWRPRTHPWTRVYSVTNWLAPAAPWCDIVSKHVGFSRKHKSSVHHTFCSHDLLVASSWISHGSAIVCHPMNAKKKFTDSRKSRHERKLRVYIYLKLWRILSLNKLPRMCKCIIVTHCSFLSTKTRMPAIERGYNRF